jgi:hypothetical protein
MGVIVRTKFEITVDIDAEAWDANYGISDPKEIREDVREMLRTGVLEHLRKLGVLGGRDV